MLPVNSLYTVSMWPFILKNNKLENSMKMVRVTTPWKCVYLSENKNASLTSHVIEYVYHWLSVGIMIGTYVII